MNNLSRDKLAVLLERCDMGREDTGDLSEKNTVSKIGNSSSCNFIARSKFFCKQNGSIELAKTTDKNVMREMKVVLERQNVSLSNETVKLTENQDTSSNDFDNPSCRLTASKSLNQRFKEQSKETGGEDYPGFIRSPKIVLKKCDEIGNNRVLLKNIKKRVKKENKLSRLKKLMQCIEKGPKIILEKCDIVKKTSDENQLSATHNKSSCHQTSVVEKEVIEERPAVIFEVNVFGKYDGETVCGRYNLNAETGGSLNENLISENVHSNNSEFQAEISTIKIEEQLEVTTEEYIYVDILNRSVAEILMEETEEQHEVTFEKNAQTCIRRKPENLLETLNIQMNNDRMCNKEADRTPNCDHSFGYPVVVKIENESEDESNEFCLFPEDHSSVEIEANETVSQNMNFENTTELKSHSSVPVVVKIENESEDEDESNEFYLFPEDHSSVEIEANETVSQNMNFENTTELNSHSSVEYFPEEASEKESLFTDAVIKLENQMEEHDDVTQELVGCYSQNSSSLHDASYWSHDVQSLLKTVKYKKTKNDQDLACKKLYTCSNCSSNFGLKKNLMRHLPKCSPSTDQLVEIHPSNNLKETPQSCSKHKYYTCRLCSRNFNQKINLMKHMEMHTTSKLLSCLLCSAQFYSESNLQAHMKSHGNNVDPNLFKKLNDEKFIPRRQRKVQKTEEPLKRSNRLATYKQKFPPSNHLKVSNASHQGKQFACILCPNNICENDSSKPHVKVNANSSKSNPTKSHKLKALLTCAQCSDSFKSKQALKHHTITHAGENLFSCKYCPAKFIRSTSLRHHSKMHKIDQPFCCKHCPAKFKQKVQLQSHTMLHNNGKSLHCPHCPASFTQKANLQSHLKIHFSDKKILNNQKFLSCNYCHGKFANAQALNSHSRSHANQKPFSCFYCSGGFSTEIKLRLHLKKFHANTKVSSGSVQKSVRFQPKKLQTSKKPLEQAKFSSASKRKLLLQTNGKEAKGKKLFSCSHCPVSFCHKASLKLHLKKHGVVDKSNKVKLCEIEKLFSCTNCSASFKSASTLNRHAVTHIMEQLFPCPWCPAKYSHKTHLQRHSKIHAHDQEKHRSRFFSYSDCCQKFKTEGGPSSHLKLHSKVKSQSSSKKFHTTNKLPRSGARKSAKISRLTILKSPRKPQKSKNSLMQANVSAKSKRKSQLSNFKESKGKKRFSCIHCSLNFCREASLKLHSKKHADISKSKKEKQVKIKEVFACSHCSAKFSQKMYLQKHTKKHYKQSSIMNLRTVHTSHTPSSVHSNQKPFPCPYCAARFVSKIKLQSHLNKHTNKASTRVHKNQHNSKGSMTCVYCSKKFGTVQALCAHSKVHSKEKPFRCKHCSAGFFSGKKLKTHLTKHTNNKQVSRIQKSVKSPHSNTLKKPNKLQNNKKLPSRSKLIVALKQKSKRENNSKVSKEKQRFSCIQCSTIFCRNAELRLHVKKHAALNKSSKVKSLKAGKIFNCLSCFANFKSLQALKNHTLTHTGKTPLSCKFCPVKFTSKINLRKHQSTHNDDRLFTCKHCPARFKSENILKTHLISHRKRKPLLCKSRPSRFKRKDSLQRHQRTRKK